MLRLITEFCSDREVILVGDFNLPSIDWNSDPPCAADRLDRSFLDAFTSLGLSQWVHEATYPRSGNILDLVFTSEPDRLGLLEVRPPLPGCDHSPTKFEYAFHSNGPHDPYLNQDPVHKLWHRANYDVIRKRLDSVDWALELLHLSAENSFTHLASILHDITDELVPVKSTEGIKCSHWFKRPPTSLIKHRHSAWEHYKNARHLFGRHSPKASAAFSSFQSLNKRYRNYTVSFQADYEEKLVLRSKDNPKLLHSYIRSKKVGQLSVGPIRLDSGRLTDSPSEMVEVFASSFASVYTKTCPPNPLPHQCFDGTIDPVSFPVERVQEALQNLDSNTAMGPDNLHPHMLKNCASQLAYPLHLIFTRSLNEGCLPSHWKSAMVSPIFKKGVRYDPLNYRPISVTSVCGKVFERILCEHLTTFLESNSILSPHQFGFRSSRSTMDQLLLVYDFVSKHIDEGGVTDVILFDFSKAFDVVVHSLLISKLQCLGIQGKILDCIHSFLSNRSMRVAIDGEKSRPREVLSGVVQGSVLGPLLFLIYINSIGSNLSCNYKIFADDLKIYACISHPNKPHPASVSNDVIQRDIDELYTTAASWGLFMNVEKCAVLRFSRPSAHLPPPSYFLNGLSIPAVRSSTDLGVLVDSSLKFHGHVQTVTKKAASLAYSFLKSTICRSPEFMVFLLITHIRPVIEYCSCVWHTGFTKDLKLLESVQRRWTKRITGLKSLSYGERLRALNLYSVRGRLLRADLIQYWKIFNGKSCISPGDLFLQPSQSRTRGHCHKIFPPVINTDVRKRSFSQRCISVWNSLPASAVCSRNVMEFKHLLDREINDDLYSYV